MMQVISKRMISVLKARKTVVEKTTDSQKELVVALNNSLIDFQKSAIGEKKSAIYSQKLAIEKQKYNEPSKANILKVYDEIEIIRI